MTGFRARPCAILKFLHPVNTQNAGQAIVWGTIPDYVTNVLLCLNGWAGWLSGWQG